MALDKDKLKTELKKWMDAPSDVKETAIDLFCDSYEKYAEDATATSGGVYESADKALMKSTLMAMPPVGTPVDSALIFANAISSFWIIAVLGVSTVSTPLVPATLAAALLPIFSNISPTETTTTKADAMSTAIHTATLTTITTNGITTGTLL